MPVASPVAGHGPMDSSWEPVVQACVTMMPLLAEALQQFWGVEVRLAFLGVSDAMHYFWRSDDFHVSQLTLEAVSAGPGQEPSEVPTALLRVSDGACSALLTRVLGPRKTAFSFKQLSPLEATVLNEFSRDILAQFKKELLRKPRKQVASEVLHLMWAFTLEDPMALSHNVAPDVGKIILSVPGNAVRWKHRLEPSADAATEMVSDAFFYHVKGDARIWLGSTRVSLADLDQLEPEDMIVLENSHVGGMYIIEPGTGEKILFQPEIPQAQQLTIPYTQELAMMETQSQSPVSAKQALWDNLMIEVSAEFEPIKLPLKQIKQMTEGLVIELGDLVQNRICLQVDGKTLAWGELMIVGDKFGVRVRQIEPTATNDEPPEMSASPVATLATPEVPAESVQSTATDTGSADEDNLDNFLNDDFDDTFEDGEDEDW